MKKQTQCMALVVSSLLLTGGLAHAQGGKSKPPVAQAWLDVATYAGFGMGGPAGGMNPLSMLGGAFGGGNDRNVFGRTVNGTTGSWLDVTLSSRNNPNLQEAIQTVPTGSKLAPELKLVAPTLQKTPPDTDDEQVVRQDFEPPKGKIYLYWGCGETIRQGQPMVLDMAKASPADYQKFFVGRRATQRGAHLAAGRPAWPNEQDSRMIPAGASLVGEHGFKGQGVPDDFKFNIASAQDIMPPLELHQRDANGATVLDWAGIPTARAYFISAMGARSENEMVFWSSSEVPENGTGLIDYQTNSAVDKWLKEKVLLRPETHTCTVPQGIFGQGAMVRAIAYGSELNLVYPPKPANPNMSWDPQWAVKVRVKSVNSTMLGMESMGGMPGARHGASGQQGQENPEQSGGDGAANGIDQGLKQLKGVFGF